MAYLIDTNVAIHLRDGDPAVTDRVDALEDALFISIISRAELENGVYRDPRWTAFRRTAIDTILTVVTTLPFEEAELAAFRTILEATSYARSRTNDRMIAASALVHDLTLITLNGSDFRDIPGLKLEAWDVVG